MMTASPAHVKGFRNLYRQQKAIAAFIGAGCSKVLNIPLWTELLIALNKQFTYYGTDEDVVKAIHQDGYPIVAGNIEKKAGDGSVYKDLISKMSRPKSCYFTSLHLELIRLTPTIVTTNYDRSFEEAFDSIDRLLGEGTLGYESFSSGDLNLIGLGEHRRVYHIHGDHDTGEFVLSNQSYIDQYRNPASDVSGLVMAVFKFFHVLFVGFSFNDEYFMEFLQSALQNAAKDPARRKPLPVHYCIVSDDLMREYLLTADFTMMKLNNIQDLLDKGILERRDTTDVTESTFYFAADAAKHISASGLPDETKTLLMDKIKGLSDNQEKLKIFDDLKIYPITFPGKNFLEIEHILKKIMEPVSDPVADSFDPGQAA